jgi:uncharacterized membrane protein YfcA
MADNLNGTTSTWNCINNDPPFARIADGSVDYYVRDVFAYPILLGLLALMMGFGKGGVPGSSTSSVALNSLLAPIGPGCLDAVVALGVPITSIADFVVVANYIHIARWDVIQRLLPPTIVGVALGTAVMGRITDSQARLLVGVILLLILIVTLVQSRFQHKSTDPKYQSKCPSGNSSVGAIAFACVVGIVGGFATMLTNSMGPILNVYLLSLRLEPAVFVGTRSTFFTVVNTLKLVQRLYSGTLSLDLALIGVGYGLIAIVGVLMSKQVIKNMSKELFMKCEYSLMTYASFKLIHAGLTQRT